MTLDQQMIDLADRHNLNHIALQLFTLDNGERFLGVNVIAGNIVGSSKGRGRTLAEYLQEAVADLRAKQAVPVVEFAALGVAA